MLWKIGLIGPVVATKGNRVEDRFSTRHAVELLARLCLRPGTSIHRDALCEELWPDEDLIERKRSRLRQALASLKRQLWSDDFGQEDLFHSDRQRIAINPRLILTDVAEFAGLVSQSRVAPEHRSDELLTRALTLYRGPFMAGFTSEWVMTQRYSLESDLLDACDRSASIKVKLGDLEAAAHVMSVGVDIDPYDQRRLTRLLSVLGDLNRQQEALRLFERHCAELEIETERELPDDLQRLAAELRSQGAVAPRVPANSPERTLTHRRVRKFPSTFTRFIGRTSETAWLTNALDQADIRMITLLGFGGVGKTRLSLHLAEELFLSGKDDVWFVFLGNISSSTALYDQLADHLRVSRTSNVGLLDQVVEELQCHPAPVLILDNLEHLVPEVGRYLTDLLIRVPDLKIVATSRHRIGISGEQEFQVELLPVPTSETVTPEELIKNESVELFRDRAKLVKVDFQVTPRNARTISELMRRLEGIPLAIELCAALAPIVSPDQMLKGLSDRFELLVSRRQDLDKRHRALFTTIEYSFQLLPPALLTDICLLATFRSGWTEATAGKLLCRRKVNVLFQELQDRSLIQSRTIEIAGEECIRFKMLDSIREFAWQHLTSIQREQYALQHAALFADYLDTLTHTHDRYDQRILGWIEQEYQEIVLALQRLLAEDKVSAAFDLCNQLNHYWSYRSVVEEGYHWYNQVLSHPLAHSVDTNTRCLAAQNQCRLAARIGDALSLFRYANDYLRLAKLANDPHHLAFALTFSGVHKHLVGDYACAAKDQEEALENAGVLQNPAVTSMILVNLGNAYWGLEQYEQSEHHFRQGISRAEEAGEIGYMAIGLCNMAEMFVCSGQVDRAYAPLRTGLQYSDQIGLVATQKLSTLIEARIALSHGEMQRTASLLIEAIDGSTREHLLSCILLGAKLLHEVGESDGAATFCGAEATLIET